MRWLVKLYVRGFSWRTEACCRVYKGNLYNFTDQLQRVRDRWFHPTIVDFQVELELGTWKWRTGKKGAFTPWFPCEWSQVGTATLQLPLPGVPLLARPSTLLQSSGRLAVHAQWETMARTIQDNWAGWIENLIMHQFVLEGNLPLGPVPTRHARCLQNLGTSPSSSKSCSNPRCSSRCSSPALPRS